MNATSKQSQPVESTGGHHTVRLGAELRQALLAWVAKHGLEPSEVIRQLVQAHLDGRLSYIDFEPQSDEADPAGTLTRLQVLPKADEGDLTRFRVSFTPSELAAIDVAAAEQGYSPALWVVAAVRAALTALPSYGQQETEALVASNRALIGALAEISAASREGRDLTAGQGDAFVGAVRAHVEAVSGFLAASVRRWTIHVPGASGRGAARSC